MLLDRAPSKLFLLKMSLLIAELVEQMNLKHSSQLKIFHNSKIPPLALYLVWKSWSINFFCAFYQSGEKSLFYIVRKLSDPHTTQFGQTRQWLVYAHTSEQIWHICCKKRWNLDKMLRPGTPRIAGRLEKHQFLNSIYSRISWQSITLTTLAAALS